MSVLLDIARWAHVMSGKSRLFSWATHALMAVPLALVFGPLAPLAVFLYREGEQVLHRYLNDVPRDWLDHIMDVVSPALVGLLFAVAPLHGQHKPMVFAAAAGMTADCVTTALALRDPLVVETNPLLPRRPGIAHLTGACVLGMATTVGVATLLPRRVRPYMYGAVALAGVVLAIHNLGT